MGAVRTNKWMWLLAFRRTERILWKRYWDRHAHNDPTWRNISWIDKYGESEVV